MNSGEDTKRLTYLWGLVGAFLSWAGTSLGATPWPEAREFLSHPPQVRELVVRRVLWSAPVSFRTRGDARRYLDDFRRGRREALAQTSVFHIRFQADPPAFFLRALADPAHLDDPSAPRLAPFVGRYETNWWSIPAVSPGQIILLHSPDGTDESPAAGGPTNTFFRSHQRWATEFLRLGLLELQPETLRWHADGRSFAALDEDGMEWTGSGQAVGAGEDVELLVRPGNRGSGKRVRVSARREAGRWMPQRLEVELLPGEDGEGGGVSRYATYEALRFTVSPEPLAREWFSPEKFLVPSDLWVELEHGRLFVLEARGTNVVRTPAPAGRGWGAWLGWVKAGAIMALALAGVRLIWVFGREWRRPGEQDLSGTGPYKKE